MLGCDANYMYSFKEIAILPWLVFGYWVLWQREREGEIQCMCGFQSPPYSNNLPCCTIEPSQSSNGKTITRKHGWKIKRNQITENIQCEHNFQMVNGVEKFPNFSMNLFCRISLALSSPPPPPGPNRSAHNHNQTNTHGTMPFCKSQWWWIQFSTLMLHLISGFFIIANFCIMYLSDFILKWLQITDVWFTYCLGRRRSADFPFVWTEKNDTVQFS